MAKKKNKKKHKTVIKIKTNEQFNNILIVRNFNGLVKQPIEKTGLENMLLEIEEAAKKQDTI